jgi:acyl carrier protein
MTKHEEVFAVIRRIVETKLEYKGAITPDADLIRELGLDSVSRTVVLVALEDHYGVTLDAAVLADVRTLGQLAERVATVVGSK